MKKFILTTIISGVTALISVSCNSPSNNTNRAVLNANTTNIALDSNSSSNTNKTVSNGEQEFLDKVLLRGFEEVQTSAIAITKAQNDEVKAFAQKVINAHSKVNVEIKDIAKRKNVTVTGGTTAEQQKAMGDLSQLSGAAFDKEYVRRMIAAYGNDVTDYQKQADGASDAVIKKFAEETLPTFKQQLQMIKELQGKIK